MNGNVPVVFPPIPIRDNFQPKAHLIQNVTNEKLAVVTTVDDHGYLDGMSVRVYVPRTYGMEILYQATDIEVLSANTFRTLIDTTSQFPFTSPAIITQFTQAQVVPISGPFENIAPD